MRWGISLWVPPQNYIKANYRMNKEPNSMALLQAYLKNPKGNYKIVKTQEEIIKNAWKTRKEQGKPTPWSAYGPSGPNSMAAALNWGLEEKRNCYPAIKTTEGKFQCPECGGEDKGTLKLIKHTDSCSNKDKMYCQQYEEYEGGKRRSKKTRKARKTKKGTYRRRR